MMKKSGQLKHKILRENLMQRLLKMNPGDAFLSVREIMDEFDVSQATVSKALEGLCEDGLLVSSVGLGTFVTEEILRHKEGAKPVVCLALPRWESSFLLQIENSFSSLAEELGYEADIMQYDWRENTPSKLPQRKIDAVLTIPSGSKMDAEDILRLNSHGKPCAILGRKVSELPVDNIYSDDNYAGALAAGHLLKLGHRKFAAIMSEPVNSVANERLEGFLAHCSIHGFDALQVDCGIKAGDQNLPKVYSKVREMLAAGSFDATGVFVISAPASLAVMKALSETGLRVPADVSLISCNGDSLSAYYNPALTVVNDPIDDMTRGGVKLLLDRVDGKGPKHPARLKYKPELVIGGSSSVIGKGGAT